MPKLYEAPSLTRFGVVGDITASDFKCTPGGDGGFTYFDQLAGSNPPYVGRNEQGTPITGEFAGIGDPALGAAGFSGCRGVSPEEQIAARGTYNQNG